MWQTNNSGGVYIGKVHHDLKHPDDGVGGGPSRIDAEWKAIGKGYGRKKTAPT